MSHRMSKQHLSCRANCFSQQECQVSTSAADIQDSLATTSTTPLHRHALPYFVLTKAEPVVQLCVACVSSLQSLVMHSVQLAEDAAT